MKNTIIIKKPDLGVIRLIPNLDKYGEGKKPFSECKGLKPYLDQGLEWFVCDNNELPSKSTLESRKQWYHDGNTVKADLSWEIRLMPDQLIKRKHIKRLQAQIDEELSKENSDPIALMKLQRKCDQCKEKKAGPHNEDVFWLEIAKINLDERVAKGEEDKLVIREKLQDKIQELKDQND